jgi:signal transduction histidine kinase
MTGGSKALVVDDEPGMRDLLGAELTRRGFEVETARDGTEALARAREGSFALVVSDVKMPRMGGLELLENLKRAAPEAAVIMVTGYGTVEAAVGAMKLGASDFVEKPFELDRLMAAVDRAMERREVESLREKNRALSASNAFLEAFAEYAAHDLATPMVQVVGCADILAERVSPALDGESREVLDRLRACARRGSALVQAVLSLARVNSRGGAFKRCDGGAIARAGRDAVAPLVEESRARIEIGTIPDLYGDAVLLEQLLVNLLKNAVTYAKPGAPARAKVSAEAKAGGRVELTVADEGVGFDEADADRIFRPFVRLGAAAREVGTGMGLAICARIAEIHGGTIKARGKPGEGAVFSVDLPSGP